jgi:hypothetical protein
MLPRLLLNNINWKRVAGPGALAAVLALLVYAYLQHVALQNAELAYEHPRTVDRVRTVRVAGPVRIVTRTVRTEGREEIVREENQGPVVEATDTARLVEPVFPPAPRLNRWLAGVGAEPFHFNEREGWRAYGGYSFANRLDLCAGLSGRGRAQFLVLVRF